MIKNDMRVFLTKYFDRIYTSEHFHNHEKIKYLLDVEFSPPFKSYLLGELYSKNNEPQLANTYLELFLKAPDSQVSLKRVHELFCLNKKN